MPADRTVARAGRGGDAARATAAPMRSVHTAAMAIDHALPGQAIDVRPLGKALADAKSSALFKSEQLEVMRLVLATGKSLPPHRVDGEITVLCLEGRVRFEADGHQTELTAGRMLFLPGGVMHSLLALDDASLLVTVVLCR